MVYFGLGAVEAIGRFTNQSPGCRQGTILAPVAAWQPLPGSGAVSALGHFGTKTRPRGRARHVTSDATDSDAAVSTRASVATRVAQSGRNFGRASERYVSKRPQCGKQDMTRAVGPATGRVTTCHGDHGRHGAGHVQRRVTAPGHSGHGAGHGIHGAGHSDGERPAGPESAAASAAGAAAFTIPFQGLEVENPSPPPP